MKSNKRPAAQWYVATATDSESEGPKYLPLHTMGGGTIPIKVSLVINETPITMELDTGAAVTIISEKHYQEHFASTHLRKSELLLKTYSGERLSVIGTMDARVQ